MHWPQWWQDDAMYAVLDIVEMAHEMKRDVQLAAQVYFALAAKLRLRWVAGEVTKLPFESHWQASQRVPRCARRFANLQRALTESVLKLALDQANVMASSARGKHHEKSLARMREVMDDLRSARETDLAMLSVLLRELRVLA